MARPNESEILAKSGSSWFNWATPLAYATSPMYTAAWKNAPTKITASMIRLANIQERAERGDCSNDRLWSSSLSESLAFQWDTAINKARDSQNRNEKVVLKKEKKWTTY